MISTEVVNLTGYQPHLHPLTFNGKRENWDVYWGEMSSCVGYQQGFRFVVVAVFEDDETAQIFATAMNAIEGFQTFTVTSLVPK
jgi:hypothetical protein